MKFFANVRLGLLFALLVVFGAVRGEAANSGGFGLTVTVSTNRYFVNNTVATTVIVTNRTGFLLDNVYVTNNFSAPVLYTSFTNFFTATNNANTNGNELDLDFSPMTNGQVAYATFTWQPQTTGFLTNTFFVASDALTNYTTFTNVSLVYGAAADLGVSLALVSQAYITNNFWVITNDWVTYQVTVTNIGPGTVSGVLLTNSLPPGIKLVSPGSVNSSNNLIYTIASLTNGASSAFQFTVQATNAGGYALASAVGAPGLYDPYSANNQSSTLLFATNYLSTLLVQTNSVQAFNPQNGLLEQTLQVVNPLIGSASAVRVVVSGLTNWFFNASGTNSGTPFVTCPALLAAGVPLDLRLQYLPAGTYPFNFPLANGQLQAYAVPASVLQYTPNPAKQYSTNLNVFGLFKLGNGDMLLEFPAVLKQSYTVLYSDNLEFSNAMIALPAYVSPGNFAQWIDYGPPATASAPTNSTRRYYRVISNP